jgi:hypothetical protein
METTTSGKWIPQMGEGFSDTEESAKGAGVVVSRTGYDQKRQEFSPPKLDISTIST